jgi:hypothetical protein
MLLLLATIGLTLLITKGSIFDNVKKKLPSILQELTNCAICTGFWAGMIVWALSHFPCLEFILYGFVGSLVSSLGITVLDWLGYFPGVDMKGWRNE